MVTVENNEQLDRVNILDRRWFPLVTFSIGVFVSLIETIYLLARGSNLENAVWPLAIRTLEITLYLRKSVPLVALLCALILSLGLWLMVRRQQGKHIAQWITHSLIFAAGVTVGAYAVYLVMNARYLRGAFLLLPTLYGFILFACAIGARGIPRLPKLNDGVLDKLYSASHLIAVFLAAWLMVPGIPALVGIAHHHQIGRYLGMAASLAHLGKF